jgi:6-phosphogluconolactonase (cycloisomerase 2 family)
VPDLGLNSIHVLEVDDDEVELVQTWRAKVEMGEGVRHISVTSDGM